jgi:hypothetical protein
MSFPDNNQLISSGLIPATLSPIQAQLNSDPPPGVIREAMLSDFRDCSGAMRGSSEARVPSSL